jgi:hypothetical protein
VTNIYYRCNIFFSELKITSGFDAFSFFNERNECVKNKKKALDYINEELKLMAKKYPNEPIQLTRTQLTPTLYF